MPNRILASLHKNDVQLSLVALSRFLGIDMLTLMRDTIFIKFQSKYGINLNM